MGNPSDWLKADREHHPPTPEPMNAPADFILKDSGVHEEFDTGSVRDTREGKGRFDLMSCYGVQQLLQREGLRVLEEDGSRNPLLGAIRSLYRWPVAHPTRAPAHLEEALECLLEALGGFTPALQRLAVVYERGALKYGVRNWEKGQPVSRYFDSAVRHLVQAYGGMRDEDHLGQGLWNVVGILHTLNWVREGRYPPELDDFPRNQGA
jgi:hypothetical protein